MSTGRVLLKYWLPVVLWMVLIFSASTDAMSSRRTSRIIGPVLRWLHPNVSEETIYRVQYAVRKTAHVVEYAILGMLTWRAARRPRKEDSRPWNWRHAGLALAIGWLYAVSDEFHQWFVPSRDGQWSDVLLDTCGVSLGVGMVWAYGRWRGRW